MVRFFGNLRIKTVPEFFVRTRDTGSAPAVFVEKYHPGASALSVVASGSVGLSLFEMRFNKNEGMLYALQLNSDMVTYSFKKIDPGAGTINRVASLGNLGTRIRILHCWIRALTDTLYLRYRLRPVRLCCTQF